MVLEQLMRFLVAAIPLMLAALPLQAQQPKMAVVGLVHSHVWGHLERLAKGKAAAELAGVAEPNSALVAEAKKAGVSDELIYSDYKAMLEKVKPEIVWAFVENNRHLEIVEYCAPRKIHVMFEKPLASTYKDALAIQRLAARHNIKVLTNYQMAWWPSNVLAKQKADSGDLGQVWRLRGIVGHGGPGSQGPRNQYFFEWLTDPVKNGAGALMDFQCYNALWALMYFGKPETVFARVNHLRPEVFPKVEDTSTMVLHYNNGVGIFEGSWDLPRSFQDLEIFGLKGSLYMTRNKVEIRTARGAPTELQGDPLPEGENDPIAYMVTRVRNNQPIQGMTALDINVDVVEIIDAAKRSVATGQAVKLGSGGASKVSRR
jgi:predicted dehydrogenase